MLKPYPFQSEGAAWLASRKRGGLFDDPGLGKTAQAILASGLAGCRRVLVLSPSVVVYNWASEWKKWGSREAFVLDAGRKAKKIREHDLVCCTHGLLLSDAVRVELLRGRKWDLVIVDEAHCFKSRTAQRTQMLYGVGCDKDFPSIISRAERVWTLTATPVPNDVSELWTWLVSLFPKRITLKGKSKPMSFWAFAKRFCVVRKTHFGFKIFGNRDAAKLREQCEGLWLRRKKREVLPQLPKKRIDMLHLRPKSMPRELMDAARSCESFVKSKIANKSKRALTALSNDKSVSEFRRLCGLAKVEPVVELLKAEWEAGEWDCITIYAYHRDVVLGVADGLRKAGLVVDTIMGGTSARMSRSIVEQFQLGGIDVIVANIVAGGVGVTLTRSSEIVLVELSFVPGENAQAVDRIDRLGQEADSIRARVVAMADTVDVDLQKSLKRKISGIREVLDS